jgi:Protein of unknown function (DUF1553)/Protein of unknown function (DUF1549)/Planctomycete cytochrome C
MTKRRIVIAVVFVAATLLATRSWWAGQRVDYSTEVKPLLNKKCIACHGGVKQSGGFSLLTREEALRPTESGHPAIVPGHADASEMIRRLHCTDPEERMPYQAEPLSADEIELLTRWIDEGANWSRHWAYQPIAQAPALPRQGTLWSGFFSKNEPDWGHNAIDAFILAKMKEHQLKPNAPADKIALLRRVCLDLTGLPPNDALRQQFLSDSSAEAYPRLVDTLLNSPHFGERWAAVWLDLARYADSKGYERDAHRNAWRYRDWLIRALNSDLPYDQFLTEQLAGDLLPNPTDDQLIATLFHRNTPTNDEGGTDNEEFRTAAVMDRVSTTWEAVMGTTFACVQCHSHPYDPFFHEEYYQFSAFFNNTRDFDTYGEFPVLRHFSPADSLKYLQLGQWLDRNAHVLDAEIFKNMARLWQPAYYSIECDSMVRSDLLDTKFLGFSQHSSARLPRVSLDNRRVMWFRYQTFVPGGTLTIRSDRADGPLLTTIQLGNTEGKWAIRSVAIPATEGYHDLYFYYQNPALRNDLEKFGNQWDWFLFAPDFPGRNQPDYAARYADFEHLLKAECEATPVMWENPANQFRTTHVFERGNWLVRGNVVKAATPKYLSAFPSGQPDNRLGLARWLTDTQHPLTARVMVNRLWEQLFGLGLVETLEDFGTQGAPPSHPELLDWLAWNFMHEQQWSIKQALRQMVLSATYRQSSELEPEQLALDPQNQWLARGARVRLSSEQIRDQSLSIAGLLNTKLYGKPVMPYQPDGIWQTPWNNDGWKESKGDEQYRRAVYTYWKRSSPYPSMMTFDGAARQVCTARRIRTNTPLQALVTLNDPVYMECAKHFALKMRAIAAKSIDEQISAGYEMATGRTIHPQKLTVLRQLYQQSLAEFSSDAQATQDFLHDLACEQHTPDLAALSLVGNAILNLDEVVVKF